ncbi:fosfomycin resistance protein [Bacillus cereus]|uniref:fosfomycin resistance protein n=1 Tax=Bacillus cereus group TaxID=86661 RepID=UPI0009B03064|nr:fosfomycin resistance protein [Bacillus cereus]OUB68885.1 fosfomycin resistance protein [Bacillus thuringiensis serovar dakota]
MLLFDFKFFLNRYINCKEIKYHPSLRHIAFRVSYEDLKESLHWLHSLQIKTVPFGSNESIEPFVRPHQGNASVYFIDPDGNSLELICHIVVPNALKHITNKLSFKDWETLLADTFE